MITLECFSSMIQIWQVSFKAPVTRVNSWWVASCDPTRKWLQNPQTSIQDVEGSANKTQLRECWGRSAPNFSSVQSLKLMDSTASILVLLITTQSTAAFHLTWTPTHLLQLVVTFAEILMHAIAFFKIIYSLTAAGSSLGSTHILHCLVEMRNLCCLNAKYLLIKRKSFNKTFFLN